MEMKRKAEEYDKMSKDYEESLQIGRSDSGDHVVMKHEKECHVCSLRLEKMFGSTEDTHRSGRNCWMLLVVQQSAQLR